MRLIAKGMDIDQRTLYGFTPLHMATCWGHECTALMLLDLGADPTRLDKSGRNPIDVCSPGAREAVLKHVAIQENPVFAGASSTVEQ